MIHFLYCNQLPEDVKPTTSLLLIADKYNIERLVQLCQDELSETLDLVNVIDALQVADQVGAEELKDSAIDFISKNVKTLIKKPDWNEIIKPNPDFLNAILAKQV